MYKDNLYTLAQLNIAMAIRTTVFDTLSYKIRSWTFYEHLNTTHMKKSIQTDRWTDRQTPMTNDQIHT